MKNLLCACLLMVCFGCSPFVSDPTRPDIRYKAKKDMQIRLNQINPMGYYKNKPKTSTVYTVFNR